MTWKRIAELILVFSIGYLLGSLLKPTTIQNIPSMEIVRDSIIRDSIYIVNDSIKTKIIYLRQKYDEKVNIIINANDSLQLDMWTRYIEGYKRADQNR